MICVASATTCAFVRISPSAEITKPVPVPSPPGSSEVTSTTDGLTAANTAGTLIPVAVAIDALLAVVVAGPGPATVVGLAETVGESR